MTEDKTPLDELIWLYRLHQAPLLVQGSGAEPFLRTGGYHTSAEDCPCFPWQECRCKCHNYDSRLGVLWVDTPVA